MSDYSHQHWYEIDTACQRAWAATGSYGEATRAANYMRRMHKQMPIAFPLPIRVWAVHDLPNGSARKRISGPWESRCRCCVSPSPTPQTKQETK